MNQPFYDDIGNVVDSDLRNRLSAYMIGCLQVLASEEEWNRALDYTK